MRRRPQPRQFGRIWLARTRSRLDWHRPGSRFRCDLGTIRHFGDG